MSTNPAELLRSSNPQERMQGIRIVAKMQNEKALRVLVKLYKEDPDEQVREFARRGAAFVANKLQEGDVPADEAPAEPEPEPEPAYDPLENWEPVEVEPKDEKRARSYIDEAMDHQMGDRSEKAIAALTKALTANPNLRTDNYFLSIAGATLGMDERDAVRTLLSADKRKNLLAEGEQAKLNAATADHMAEAEKHTWNTLTVDIAIFAAILFLGGLLSLLVVDYGAGVQVNNLESRLNGTIDTETGAVITPPLDPVENPETFASLQESLAIATGIQSGLNAGIAFGVAFLLAAGMLPSVLLLGFIVHPISMRLLNGQGTALYGVFNLLNAYNIPLVVMFALLIVTAI
ncbi:MAG: hypothetical protein AAF125_26765, partial [Chloroflexota bacterium]